MPRGDTARSQTTKATLGLRELIFAGELAPDTALTGCFVHDATPADVGQVLYEVDEARKEAEARERGRLAAAAVE